MIAKKNLSDNEYIIMQHLWEVGESTSTLITKALYDEKQWDAAIVRRYLKIMLDKKFISYREEKKGKRKKYYYYPLLTVDQYAASKSSYIINRFYNGDLCSMVMGLVENRNLSEKELDDLEKALQEFKENRGENDD